MFYIHINVFNVFINVFDSELTCMLLSAVIVFL